MTIDASGWNERGWRLVDDLRRMRTRVVAHRERREPVVLEYDEHGAWVQALTDAIDVLAAFHAPAGKPECG